MIEAIRIRRAGNHWEAFYKGGWYIGGESSDELLREMWAVHGGDVPALIFLGHVF